MTKNNAFKKTIRSYMEEYNVSYTAARKILDEESYLQGTGAITLIVGGTGTGKTIQFRELLKSQALPAAVILAHQEDIDYIKTTHYVESLPYLTNEHRIRLRVDALQNKKNLQNLVNQKKYSTFALDGIDYLANQGDKHLLDILPRKADLILTFQFHPIEADYDGEASVGETLDHLDNMNLSREKLSNRVKLIKHTTLDSYDRSKSRKDRFRVTDYLI